EDASNASADVDLEKIDNSDSEFELTLDEEGDLGVEEGGKDIFEETNFDLPPLDDESQSEAVALEEPDTDLESSDFDLSMEEGAESGSQVVTRDEDEEADDAAATVAKARKGAAKAPAKTKAKKAPVEEEPEPSLDDAMADWDPKARRMAGPAKETEEEEEE